MPKKNTTKKKTRKGSSNDPVEDAIMRFENSELFESDYSGPPKYLPTTNPYVDYQILRKGGVPVGKIIEIFGDSESAKSILMAVMLGERQKQEPNKKVAIIDTEFSADLDFMALFGLDKKRVVLKRTNIAEQVANLAIEFTESGLISGVGIDSIGNMNAAKNTRGARFEKEKGKENYQADQPGMEATITGKMAKRLANSAFMYECSIIGVNHVHDKIGSYTGGKTNSGGKKWRYNRHVALELTRLGDIKAGEKVLGIEVRCRVARSKISATGVTKDGTHFKFYFEGISAGRAVQLFDTAVMLGIIQKKGSMYRWMDDDGEEALYQWRGKNTAVEELKSDEDLLDTLGTWVAEAQKELSTGVDNNYDDVDE